MGVMTVEFERWYRDVHEPLVGALSRALADEGRARDAVDEALVRALERWQHVATLDSPAGWTYVVALNVARRTLRRAGFESDRLEGGGVDWAGAGGTDVRADPVAEAVTSGASLLRLVAELPERQRAVVSLRHELDLTEREIAERLGIARSTVSSTLRDAHRALARKLRPRAAEEDAMDLQLARMVRGGGDGCEVTYLEGEVTEWVAFGSAVRDQIRVRRDDLVAVDVSVDPAEVVWRWWHGVVDSATPVGSGGSEAGVAMVRRPAGDGMATVEVCVPPELEGAIHVGDSVWFGREDDDLVAVAARGRSDPALARLAAVAEAYG